MNRRGFFCRPLGIGAVAATTMGLIGICGCGGNDRPKTIPISGRVTVNGEAPGEFGKLFFTPTQAAEGYGKRPANGSFDAEGVYRVMSWQADDGLVPGHYTVNLMPADPAQTKIPERYFQSATSGLEVDVPVDAEKIEYEVKVTTP